MQVRFWLDAMRDDEYQLLEYVDEQKQQRSFAQTMRDALNLIRDLRQGRTDWLLFLFPWVYSAIYAQAEADLLNRQPEPPQQDRLASEIARLSAQIEAMGAIPIGDGQKPSAAPVPRLKAPSEPEPELEIKTAKSEVPSSWNFAITTAGVTGNYDKLPPEVLRYAIDSGRIQRKQLSTETRQKLDFDAQNTVAMKPVGNARKMDINTNLPPPSFDDDDDDDIGLFLSGN